jgi:hypothetical protein
VGKLDKKFSGTDTDIGTPVDGTTPIILACFGAIKILKTGADVNICNDYGQSALYLASLRDFINIVHTLCAAVPRADPTSPRLQLRLQMCITEAKLKLFLPKRLSLDGEKDKIKRLQYKVKDHLQICFASG